MPIVKKQVRSVSVTYELVCRFERACALANDVYEKLEGDPGLLSIKEDSRGWDFAVSVVIVQYASLEDANRLDEAVRQGLSRCVDFTYEDVKFVGQLEPITTITEKPSSRERERGV